MKRVTYNECGFADIFHFAESKNIASWNECCDLFHRSGILQYEAPTDIYLADIEDEMKDEEDDSKYKKAYQILIDFMNENHVKTMHVTGA